MEVGKLAKYVYLEWKKLRRLNVISEVIVYFLIIMFLPVLFFKEIFPLASGSYDSAIDVLAGMQVGFVLFGASLINQVFVEEFKTKTIVLNDSYPITRKKLFTAKILFIAIFVFFASVLSFILTGISTIVLDQLFSLIQGEPTMKILIEYLGLMFNRSIIITFISFLPLFLFGFWKRSVVLLVVTAIFAMQFPNFAYLFHFDYQITLFVLAILGFCSILATLLTAERFSEV